MAARAGRHFRSECVLFHLNTNCGPRLVNRPSVTQRSRKGTFQIRHHLIQQAKKTALLNRPLLLVNYYKYCVFVGAGEGT